MRNRIFTIALLLCALPLCALPVPSSAQSHGDDADELHIIREAIERITPRPLTPGDTLISWSPSPVLVHTVHLAGDTVHSNMLRDDGLLIDLSTLTANGLPLSFDEASWRDSDLPATAVSGSVVEGRLQLTGGRDTVLDIPEMIWAVADYGMDDHLVPALLRLPDDGEEHSIAVFRPYIAKWDTITVKSTSLGEIRVVTEYSPSEGPIHRIIVDDRLLWIQWSDFDRVREPLWGSPAWERYVEVFEQLEQ
ncbi:MAG: hypothetical protein LBG44_06020 [Gemmatimonadota bacterium]|jgi:hypothetical protein|nr:hypothetical protein [Gemmatimonadota bacterium]